MAGRAFVALAAALLLAGCIAFSPESHSLRSPEADAIFYLAVRDEALNAEVLWSGVHDNIKAETSRSEFIDCVYKNADRTGPASTLPESGEYELQVGDVAMYGGEVPSDNVLVRDGKTYSVTDHRDDTGIISVDVRVERSQAISVTTVLLAPDVVDSHDPDGAGPYWAVEEGLVVVGTVPEDPCLVGGGAVRERLQTTGSISIGRDQGQRPELIDYRVLAVVWDGAPDDGNLVGGAFWWLDDEGNGGDGVHPPSEGDGATGGDVENDSVAGGDEPDEPRRAPDWVDHAFLQTTTPRIELGSYTIEVWANPSELTPSANPRIPAEVNERNCTVEVEVTAGEHLNVFIKDIPTDGGECPHETEFRFGF